MMADLDKIMKALRNAHAAGDTAAATRLAGMAKAAKADPGQAMRDRIAAAKAGTLQMQPGSAERAADANAQAAAGMARPGRSAVYDNLIGDSTDGVDSFGERIGRGLNDVASAGAAGIARGTAGLVGLPGTLGDLASTGMTRAGQAVGVIPDNWRPPAQSPLSSGALVDSMGRASGGATNFRGQTTAGQYAGTVGEFLPGAAALGGMNPANLAKFGVAPGVASEAAGQATEGTSMEGPARIAGALVGGIAPGLIAGGARRVISPYGGADPERLKLASVLDDFGVPISAGQRVGNEALRRKEGLTVAGQNLSEAQREAFTAAALKTAGTNATRATPDVLAETATRIGSVFDDVTRGVDVTPDPQSLTALSKAVNEYKSLAPTGNQAPLVSAVFKDVTNAFRGRNAIPAATVNTWRSGLSKLTASPDAATRAAAQSALETIDDMLTGSLTAAGRVDDVARLATARGEWRNFLAIQKAATGAGEGAAAGLLSPSALRSAVVQQGRSAYAQGRRGDLGELSRAGEGVIKALPDSGTPAGLAARMAPGTIQSGAGAVIGSAVGGPVGAAIGALAGAAAPGITGALRMTGPVQAYLANQLAPRGALGVVPGTGSALLPFAAENRNALAGP
jgi:hypothetical protein